ncbi:hypothetical protein CRN76_10460 [Chryseobacterium indologenes]|nr:hypothetical protein CRN76_10460 [Chryseobacterium indologenes]AYY85457.1 hypothetical protein EGX91_13285 [Chryseobacterium indologenes]
MNAQNVGIKTTSPKAPLDVNGTININKEIYLEGTETNIGNAGNTGDLLAGNGTGKTQWRNFNLPAGYGDLILSNSYVGSTSTGTVISGTGNAPTLSVPYTADQGMTTPKAWQQINQITTPFTISKTTNISNIAVQTMVQINTSSTASFACGIFIDDKLKTVRTGNLSGGAGSYILFNVNTSLINQPVGSHTLKFACVERNVPTGTSLAFGQPIDTSNLNNDMAETAYSISVLEPGF